MLRTLAILVLLAFAAPLAADVPPSPTLDELSAWMKEALAQAEQIAEEERRPLQRELFYKRQTQMSRVESMKQALFAIALRPRDVRSAQWLIGAAGRRRTESKNTMYSEEDMAQAVSDRAAATAFLERLYRSHAGTDSEAALHWQSGYAELLLMMGKFDEALRLERQNVALLEDEVFPRVRLAILEKIAGNDEPLATLIANCPGPPEEYSYLTENYCYIVARQIADRVRGTLAEKTPVAISEVLSGKGLDGASWEERMHGLVTLQQADFAGLKDKRLEEVLAAPDAPEYVKNDALLLMTTTGSANSDVSKRKLAQLDEFIARKKIVFPPFPQDGWTKLASFEPAANREPDSVSLDGCYDHDHRRDRPVPMAGFCMQQILNSRVRHALTVRNWAAARQTIEWAAAITLATGRDEWHVVALLKDYGEALARTRQPEAARIFRYTHDLPFTTSVGDVGEKLLRNQTERVTEPWPR